MSNTIHEVSQEAWPQVFQQITRRRKGQPVSIRFHQDGAGVESVVTRLPFISITADEAREGLDEPVRVVAGEAKGTLFTQTVAAAAHVRVEESPDHDPRRVLIESVCGPEVVVDFDPA